MLQFLLRIPIHFFYLFLPLLSALILFPSLNKKKKIELRNAMSARNEHDDDSPPMEPMTAEEEAELLAQYGTANTFFDDLVDIQAPSQYRSMYHSSTLFLIGGVVEGEEVTAQERSAQVPIVDELDCRAPLELYVLRHLTTTSAAAPSSYSEALGCAMQALNEFHQSQAQKVCTVPRSEAEKTALRELLLSPAATTSNDDEDRNSATAYQLLPSTAEGDDEEAMNRHIDGLLKEVDAELQRTNFHYDPATDEVFQARLKELQEVYAVEPLHDEAFEDDAQLLDDHELLEIKETIEARAPAVYLNAEEVVEQNELAAAIDKRIALRKQQLEEQEEKKTAFFKEGAREAETLLSGNARLVSAPVSAAPNLLEHIARIDQRDSELEQQATLRLREHMTSTRSAMDAREARQRQKAQIADTQGKLVFQEFVSKLDAVLPPTALSLAAAAAASPTTGASSGVTSSSSAAVSVGPSVVAAPSLADIKKKARRDEFLSRREAIERRLMRDEEARVEAFLRQLEMIRVQNEDRIENFKHSEMNLRRAVLSEEAIAHVEMTVREERQRQTILQFLQQRAAQRQAKAASEITQAYESLRESLVHMESHEWADLILSSTTNRTAIEARAAVVEEQLLMLEKMLLQEMIRRRAEFVKKAQQEAHAITTRCLQRAMTQDLMHDAFPSFTDLELFSRAAFLDSCGFGSRVVASADVLQSRNSWSVKFKKESVSALQGIHMAQSAALPHRLSQKKRANANAALLESKRPPTSTSGLTNPSLANATPAVQDSAAESLGVTLNAKMLKKLIPMQLAEAAVDMSRCPQVFYSLSLALESISAIDFDSVANLSVEPFTEKRQRLNESIDGALNQFSALAGIRIAPFVKDLDLSSNELASLSFEHLCSVFSSLTHLRAAHNKLQRLFPVRFAAQPNQPLSHIFSLNVSANRLESVEGLSFFPELRNLVLYSNQIQALRDLKDCSRLYDVEMSRNAVESLDGVDALSTLRTLDLSYNRVQDLQPLTKSLLVQKLFLSNNRITAFPSTNSLIFLRQLYLNDNQLTQIPAEVRWMPFLVDVHLESNKLSSIEGLRHCTQLQILKLSFNQFSHGVADVAVLSACKRMEVFSINDNPMMRSAATAQDVHRCALQIFPRLREYNNEVVSASARQHARDRQVLLDGLSIMGSVVARSPSAVECWVNSGTVVPFLRCSSQLFVEHSVPASGKNSSVDGSDVPPSILSVAFERQLSNMQREYESIYVDGNRKYQQALAVEEGIASKRRDGHTAAMYVHSSVLASRNYSDSLSCSQRHLEFLRENVTVNSQLNMHTVSVPYEVKSRRYLEQRARERLSAWITGRVLIQKARRELETLRDASEAGRLKRQQAATQVIQRYGRGLIGRKRISKLLALARAEDDDDMLFTKVTFDDPSSGQSGTSAFASLAGRTPSVPFQVIAPTRKPNAGMSDGVSTLLRTSSAPHDADDGSRGMGRRPQSNPGLASSLPTAEASPPPKTSRSALDDEWGAALADQLRKKQKKMDRARNDMIRKEFLSDPLKAKKLAGK